MPCQQLPLSKILNEMTGRMSAHQCIFSALLEEACDPHTELASFILLVPSLSIFFRPVHALPYCILNIIINYYYVVIAMIAIINFILVPLWSLHSPPVLGPMEAKRRSLGTFRQHEPHEGLGNVRPSWAPLLQPGFAQSEQDMEN